MEFKIGRANFSPRSGLVAAGAATAAIALGGCGLWDGHKEPIVIPPDARERVEGGNDRAFVMDDTEINRLVFSCGRFVKNQAFDGIHADPVWESLGHEGKVLGVCENVREDWPVERISAK